MTPDELQKKVAGLGTILGVWAHPDDEVFMTGGLMAIAVNNGQTVACVTATRGEQGVQNEQKWPSAHLAEIRTQELAAAYKILGINNHHWLDYPDGGCEQVDTAAAVSRIADYINTYQPDTIVTFPPHGSTGHPDHMAVCQWACAAAKSAKKKTTVLFSIDLQEAYDNYWRTLDEQFNIYFNIDRPKLVLESQCDLLLRLSSELCAQKCDALCAMPSQTEAMVQATGKEELCKVVATEGYVKSTRSDLSGVSL